MFVYDHPDAVATQDDEVVGFIALVPHTDDSTRSISWRWPRRSTVEEWDPRSSTGRRAGVESGRHENAALVLVKHMICGGD